MKKLKRILITPLNWGLGHATRCIPIIDELIKQDADVFVASDGRAYDLLKKEYPLLPIFFLPSYDIHYRGKNILLHLFLQGPKMLRAIYKEHQEIKRIVEEYQIDLIISDNRYGCYHAKIPSIILTHQLEIKTASTFLSFFVNKMNHFFIRQFTQCWVPDIEGENNLSGELSHQTDLSNLHFIGALSRMNFYVRKKKYDVLVILSGPEPQRTYLEEKIIEQARKLDFTFLLLQGKTELEKHFFETENIEVKSYLTSKDLNDAIMESEIIMSRSGYSTIMDLARVKKKAILIPTPKQTEQEYLAKHFHEKKIFFTQIQKELNLVEALKEVKKYSGFHSLMKNRKLKIQIAKLLDSI